MSEYLKTKIFSRDTNILPQMHWMSNIFWHSATTIGGWGEGGWVSLNYPITKLTPRKRYAQKTSGCTIDVKMDGSILELSWGSCNISIAKTASKKIGTLIRSLKFFAPEFALYLKSTIWPCIEQCYYVWPGPPSCYLDLSDKLQKQIFRNGFESRINRHLLTICSFQTDFLYIWFNLFVVILGTPCLVVAVQLCMEWVPIKEEEISGNINSGARKEKDILQIQWVEICRSFFFLIGIHSMQGWAATMRHGLQEKEAQKD